MYPGRKRKLRKNKELDKLWKEWGKKKIKSQKEFNSKVIELFTGGSSTIKKNGFEKEIIGKIIGHSPNLGKQIQWSNGSITWCKKPIL